MLAKLKISFYSKSCLNFFIQNYIFLNMKYYEICLFTGNKNYIIYYQLYENC